MRHEDCPARCAILQKKIICSVFGLTTTTGIVEAPDGVPCCLTVSVSTSLLGAKIILPANHTTGLVRRDEKLSLKSLQIELFPKSQVSQIIAIEGQFIIIIREEMT